MRYTKHTEGANDMRYCGIVDLPDDRSVLAQLEGFTERDTNAWVETSLEIEWRDGRGLSAEEYNIEFSYREYDDIEFPGYFLHEWVAEKLLAAGKTCD